LAYELKNAGFSIMTEKALPLIYEEVKLEAGYRIDILVNKLIDLEVKSAEALSKIHTAQMLTYLKLSGCRLGYLLNFNVKSMKNGIKRLIMT
jgi:GxxExxY protein